MYRKLFAVSIIALSLSVAGCSSDDDDDDSSSTGTSDSDPSGADADADADADSGMDTLAPPPATPGEGNSVYDNIFNDPGLSILRNAIEVAGLAATLDNEAAEFTIFAPSNAAFGTLDPGLLPTLLLDPTGQLISTLTFHVVEGTITAEQAASAAPTELETLNGATISVGTSDAGLTIGAANITGPDSNYDPANSVGVVHIIDSVLIP